MSERSEDALREAEHMPCFFIQGMQPRIEYAGLAPMRTSVNTEVFSLPIKILLHIPAGEGEEVIFHRSCMSKAVLLIPFS